MATIQLCSVDDILRAPAFTVVKSNSLIPDTGPTDDQKEFMQLVVDAVSDDFEEACCRYFKKQAYTEILDAKSQQRLFRVRGYPVVPDSVSIKHSVSGDFASETAMDETNFHLLDNGRLGMIKFRPGYGYIATGVVNVQITYTGGLGEDIEKIDKSLRLAAVEQCIYILRRNPQLHVKSEAISQGQGGQGAATTFYNDAPRLVSVQLVLNRYRMKG